MQNFHRIPRSGPTTPCALAIGNFDGVHRGHQALLTQLMARARAEELTTQVLTFDPHPRAHFAQQRGVPPEQWPARVQNLRDRTQALLGFGVDRVVVAPFDARLAALPAETFIEEVLVNRLQARILVVGPDFRFGAGRRGDLAMLRTRGAALGLSVATLADVLDPETGARVSSSALRTALANGDFAAVQRKLGRPYTISGRVVHGRKLGRTLGFPTLNIRMPRGRPAAHGVFVVTVHGLGPVAVPGVASLGNRPAVESGGMPLLEVHALDWSGDAYGRLIEVRFHHYLRPELPFDGLAALTESIAADCRSAHKWFQQNGLSGDGTPACLT